MDVTLERVQFKFASIIGELCSKPLILSQFAVWVDLRLSEYKLKGAISLDCSGDKPDPDWLKGIKDELQLEQGRLSPHINLSKVRQRNNESNQTTREVSDVSSRDFDNPESEALELRNSPNVSIKQEMDEEGIYPVGLHRHQAEYRERKRSLSSAGLNRGETSHYSQSPLKMRKSSDFSAIDTLQESNQSLMSIIGSDNDASSLTVEEAKNNIDLAMAAQIQDNLQQQMGDNSLNSPFTSGRPSQPSSTITKSSPYPLDAIPSPSTAKSGRGSRPQPGRVSTELAKSFNMIELREGTGVYLHHDMVQVALGLCSTRCRMSRKPQGSLRDGQPAARFLLGMFFSKEQIASGTISQSSDQSNSKILDPLIIDIITGDVRYAGRFATTGNGIMEKDQAEQLGMTELVHGSNAYINEQTYQLAIRKCSVPWTNPNSLYSPEHTETEGRKDGKPAARFLMGRFFSKEQLTNGTISKYAKDTDLKLLDPRITQAIIDFCLCHSDSKRSEILEALRCVTTALRYKLKKKKAGKLSFMK